MKKFKRILSIVLVCAMALCVLTACSGSGSGNSGSSSNSGTSTSAEAKEIIAAVNSARKAAGKSEFTESAYLNSAAEKEVALYASFRQNEITKDQWDQQSNALGIQQRTGGWFASYHAGISFANESYVTGLSGNYIGCATLTVNGVTYFVWLVGNK